MFRDIYDSVKTIGGHDSNKLINVLSDFIENQNTIMKQVIRLWLNQNSCGLQTAVVFKRSSDLS